jgi:hypothetical protein
MKRLRIGLMLVVAHAVSSAALANEFGKLPEVRQITDGQPEDVAAFIERTVECNHWGGEEPYDKDRAAQIKTAVERAKCDHLNSDEQALKNEYRGKRKVLEALERAKLTAI